MPLVYRALGRNDESQAALGSLIRDQSGVAAFQIAEAHAFRGDIDAAFAWLERAYRQRDAGPLIDLKLSELLNNLWDDPRYTAFLDKMGLPTGR
jgi:serine/threonine-protein kinase